MREALASACLWAGSMAAQEVTTDSTASEDRLTIDGPMQADAGEPWSASARGCSGPVEWAIEGLDAAPPAGADTTLTWDRRGVRRVVASCGDGREARMVVVVTDGAPYVEIVDLVNQDGTTIGFTDRLAADVAYADAPANSTLRMVLYRGSAPVTGGGRSEIIDDSVGIARVDGYCLSSGPVHHVEVILEDMHTAERIAGSGRIKVRKRKLECVD